MEMEDDHEDHSESGDSDVGGTPKAGVDEEVHGETGETEDHEDTLPSEPQESRYNLRPRHNLVSN